MWHFYPLRIGRASVRNFNVDRPIWVLILSRYHIQSNAPKGGTLILGEVGIRSLNPHIIKGRAPWQLQFWAYETLMGRSWDEPFTLYGLLAETIETGRNREWVEFSLRPEARFSDGSPVTVEDVLWSMKRLGQLGIGAIAGCGEN